MDITSDDTVHEHYPEEVFPIEGLEHKPYLKYKIINIVMIADLEESINIKMLCVTMPVVVIDGFEKRKKKISIPYYGLEDIVVSVNYDVQSRGIRVIKKPLKKILYVDYQYYGKNQHIKISSKNIHITGIRSENAGECCINAILDRIQRLNILINAIKDLPDETKNMLMTCMLSEDEDVTDDMRLVFHESNGMLNNAYNYLKSHKNGRTEETYKEYVHSVLYDKDVLCSPLLDVSKFVVHNKVFYIDTHHNINIRHVNRLFEQSGVVVIFYNWIDVQSTEIIIRDTENMNKYTTLKIHGSGGVNLWCDSDSDRAFRAFRNAVDLLEQCYMSKCVKKRRYERKTPRRNI